MCVQNSVVSINICTGNGYKVCFAEKRLQPSDQVYFADCDLLLFNVSRSHSYCLTYMKGRWLVLSKLQLYCYTHSDHYSVLFINSA